jgi:hypothetical protein
MSLDLLQRVSKQKQAVSIVHFVQKQAYFLVALVLTDYHLWKQ